MASVMRRLEWAAMDEAARTAFCARGLAAIFDPELRASIVALIDDVPAPGDAAVADALARFDGVTVDAGPAAHHGRRAGRRHRAARRRGGARRRHRPLPGLQRAGDGAGRRLELRGRTGPAVGEKVSPIASVGLFVPSGKASYPSVAYQLGVPATVAGVPRSSSSCRRSPGGGGAVDPAVLVVCRKLGITDVFRVNGPAGLAALAVRHRVDPAVRKVVGPGSPAVTCAQVELQRHGVATMMVLGPTESLVSPTAAPTPSGWPPTC